MIDVVGNRFVTTTKTAMGCVQRTEIGEIREKEKGPAYRAVLQFRYQCGSKLLSSQFLILLFRQHIHDVDAVVDVDDVTATQVICEFRF
jgi:hypothetical protein